MFVYLTHRKLIGSVMLMALIFTSSAFAEATKESLDPTGTFLESITLEETTDLEYNAYITSLYDMVVEKRKCT